MTLVGNGDDNIRCATGLQVAGGMRQTDRQVGESVAECRRLLLYSSGTGADVGMDTGAGAAVAAEWIYDVLAGVGEVPVQSGHPFETAPRVVASRHIGTEAGKGVARQQQCCNSAVLMKIPFMTMVPAV